MIISHHSLLFIEISNTDSSSYKELKVFLNIFDYLSLMVFILEILLKWIDGFIDFWKNGWNVFDFFVTVMVSYFQSLKCLLQDFYKVFSCVKINNI